MALIGQPTEYLLTTTPYSLLATQAALHPLLTILSRKGLRADTTIVFQSVTKQGSTAVVTRKEQERHSCIAQSHVDLPRLYNILFKWGIFAAKTIDT